MKITDYMQNAMDILRAEFDFRENDGQDEPAYLGGYRDRPIFTLGVEVDDFLVMAGAETAHGANSMALVFDEGVIKWSKGDELDSHYTTNEDARFYHMTVERFPKYQKYLAETIQVGMFTVQEMIRPSRELMFDLSDDERFNLYATIIRVAHDLGLRDIHMGNWGFRGRDLTTPVIFDFSDRTNTKSVMHWHRLNPQFEWDDWNIARDYTMHLEQMLSDLNDFAEDDGDDDVGYDGD